MMVPGAGVEPGVAVGGRSTTSGTFDPFGGLHDPWQVLLDTAASGRLAVTGYIVTGKGVYRCSASYNNDNGRYLVVNRGRCSGARNYPERLARALASIPELVKHKDHASCDTMDGGGAEIEGILDGEKFHFTAMNSHDCDEARPVAEILDLLANSASERDREQ